MDYLNQIKQPNNATRDKLLAEEAAVKATVQPKRETISAEKAAYMYIINQGHGAPTLEAKADKAIDGPRQLPNGQLAGVILCNSTDIFDLAEELGWKGGSQRIHYADPDHGYEAPPVEVKKVAHFDQPILIIPPDAPASDPELASKPVEGWSAIQAIDMSRPITEAEKLEVRASEAEKKKRGRPAKAKEPVTVEAAKEQVTTQYYIDTHTPLVKTEDMTKNVMAWFQGFNSEAGVEDARYSDKRTLDYGKWKIAFAVYLQDKLPTEGAWYLDSRSNEDIAKVVADALLTLAHSKGYLYARGLR